MSAMMLKVESMLPKFWIALVLGSVLSFSACESTPTVPTPRDEDEEESPVGATDEGDEEAVDEEAPDDESAPAPKPDAGKPKPDAGTKPKPDAAIDAKAPSAEPDAGTPEPTEGTDAGGDAKVTNPADGGETGGETGHEDLGKGDGKDVITIGDSWMNYALNGGGIERGLLEASGQPYRTYGVAATRLLDGVIPRQYASAKRENPDIKTVVMAAGGNDILLTGANPAEQIEKIGKRLDELWTEMGKDGVKDVVYIEYSEGGGNGPNVRMGIEKVGPICKNHKALRCHFMLSDPIIMMQLSLDNIHPTADGCTKLGKAAFDLMVAEGMRR